MIRKKAKRPQDKKNIPTHPMTMPLKRLVKTNKKVVFSYWISKSIQVVIVTVPALAAAGPMASLAAASAGASLAGAGAGSESHHGLHHASDTTAFDSYLSKLQVGV